MPDMERGESNAWVNQTATKPKFVFKYGELESYKTYMDSTIILTGGSQGLGLKVAQELAHALVGGKGFLILGVRDVPSGQELKRNILANVLNSAVVSDRHFALAEKIKENEERIKNFQLREQGKPRGGISSINDPKIFRNRIHVIQLDLASLKSVRSFVSTLEENPLLPPLRCLILGASTMNLKGQRTLSNHELTFGVNHLSHFLLTKLLIPKMMHGNESVPSRVLVLSSTSAFYFRMISKKHLSNEEAVLSKLVHTSSIPSQITAMMHYGSSKLLNIIFSEHTNEKYAEDNITAVCVCPIKAVFPAMMKTGLMNTIYRRVFGNSEEAQDAGCDAILHALFVERTSSSTGLYIEQEPAKLPKYLQGAEGKKIQQVLFDISESLCRFS